MVIYAKFLPIREEELGGGYIQQLNNCRKEDVQKRNGFFFNIHLRRKTEKSGSVHPVVSYL